MDYYLIAFLVVGLIVGTGFGRLIEQFNNRGPKVIEWREPFIIRRGGKTVFMGRANTVRRDFHGPTSLEALSLDAFMNDPHPPKAR